MNRKLVRSLILLTFIVLAACGTSNSNAYEKNDAEADIQGFILDKTDSSILVVSKQAQDFSANGGISEYYDAIWLSEAPENVNVGQEVKVWYEGGVQESYPMGGKVGKLEIVPSTKPKGATLTNEEALQKAIENQQNVAVISIEFDNELGIWIIELKDLLEDNKWTVEVADMEINASEPDISGYIMDKEDDRILVVNPEAEDFSKTGGISEFYDAVWASYSKEIQVGEKVKVWYDGGVNESYPAQAAVGELEIISIAKPEGANLTESEALRKALKDQKEEYQVLVVKSIEFEKELGQWNIEVKDTADGEAYMLQVADN